MPAFPQLATLKLRAWKHTIHPYDNIDLDLTCVQSLRHLHIENWAPRSIGVTRGCRVHAVWQYHDDDDAWYPISLDWLGSPCWSTSGTALASFTFDASRLYLVSAVCAINRIMECQNGLELLKIAARHNGLGWKDAPLKFPSQCDDGLRVPLRVEINTRLRCFIHLDDDTPLGKAIVLKIKGPIEIATPGASDDLHWYTLKSLSASGVDKGYMSLRWQPAEA